MRVAQLFSDSLGAPLLNSFFDGPRENICTDSLEEIVENLGPHCRRMFWLQTEFTAVAKTRCKMDGTGAMQMERLLIQRGLLYTIFYAIDVSELFEEFFAHR
jgi:hypothetical protein